MRLERPSWRKPVGMLLILLMILVWAVIVVTAFGFIAHLPWFVHLIYYMVAGIAWIFPAYRIMIWMELGRWSLPPRQ